MGIESEKITVTQKMEKRKILPRQSRASENAPPIFPQNSGHGNHFQKSRMVQLHIEREVRSSVLEHCGERQMHSYKRGDYVTVFSMTFGGQFIIEGHGRVVKRVKGVDEQYHVQFDGDTQTVERFVDPWGQNNPEAHVAELNMRAAG